MIQHVEQLTDSACVSAFDLEPLGDDIDELDALELTEQDLEGAQLIITNPPWDRKILHPMIEHFSNLRPTWLLFDADWIHTIQSAALVRARLCKIVSVGRVKWIEDSAGSGKDNAAWYLFDKNKFSHTEFFGRSTK